MRSGCCVETFILVLYLSIGFSIFPGLKYLSCLSFVIWILSLICFSSFVTLSLLSGKRSSMSDSIFSLPLAALPYTPLREAGCGTRVWNQGVSVFRRRCRLITRLSVFWSLYLRLCLCLLPLTFLFSCPLAIYPSICMFVPLSLCPLYVCSCLRISTCLSLCTYSPLTQAYFPVP